MLINLSNHPSTNWSKEQLQAANNQFGEVVDLAFPNVPPTASKDEVTNLVAEYVEKCNTIANYNRNTTIHVMGEMTFVYAFVYHIDICTSYTCIASTTERKSSINPDGTKNVSFVFVRFRPY